ncbi:MAG: radical SAM protein, partial [Clostridia bacterium]|nr:radical SAM protein [Clostridia bacterium]
MAIVRYVEKKSPFRKKILPGDDLIALNDTPVRDFLDYMYLTASGVTKATVLRNGETITVEIPETSDDLGMDFENYLMDKQRSCKNKC